MKIASVFLVSVGFTVAPACASDLNSKINELGQIAELSYTLCSMKADIAVSKIQLGSDKTSAAQPVFDCIATNLDSGSRVLDEIKPMIASKPAAESALKNFYSNWKAEMQGIVGGGSPKSQALATFKQNIETVKTELVW